MNIKADSKLFLGYSCYCGRIFRYNNELTYHRRRECGKLFPCPLCKSRLSTKGNLKTHIVNVHKDAGDINEIVEKVTPIDKSLIENVPTLHDGYLKFKII